MSLKNRGRERHKKQQTIIRCKYCNTKLILEDLMAEEYCEKAPDGSLVITCTECDGQFLEK